MKEELTILNDFWMWYVVKNKAAANVLYHLLGGKESHTVCLTRRRGISWSSSKNGSIDSCEMLAKDNSDFCHSMTIRFIDSLERISEIREHPLGDIWEYRIAGKDYFSEPLTQVYVYFVRSKLPGDVLSCRVGFPMLPDDLNICVWQPTLIISTEMDDGSDLSKLVQYLKKPFPDRTIYGNLSERITDLLEMPEN